MIFIFGPSKRPFVFFLGFLSKSKLKISPTQHKPLVFALSRPADLEETDGCNAWTWARVGEWKHHCWRCFSWGFFDHFHRFRATDGRQPLFLWAVKGLRLAVQRGPIFMSFCLPCQAQYQPSQAVPHRKLCDAGCEFLFLCVYELIEYMVQVALKGNKTACRCSSLFTLFLFSTFRWWFISTWIHSSKVFCFAALPFCTRKQVEDGFQFTKRNDHVISGCSTESWLLFGDSASAQRCFFFGGKKWEESGEGC